MPNKPKILFVYDHPKPEWWQDGLAASLDLLEEDFEVTRLNLRDKVRYDSNVFDFILGHGAFGSSVDQYISQARHKKALCIAGNALPPTNANSYDILFHETDWIKDVYLRGVTTKLVKAFGVNTDLFCPLDMPTPIVWDYIGVGAFASWKRWEKMGSKQGNRLVIGEVQEGNLGESMAIASNLLRNGVMCSNMTNPLDLATMYHYSRTLYMPSTVLGGGERSVLEARSSGLGVLVEDDNPKLKELVDMPVIPSHFDYAKALKEGILSVI